MEEQVRRALLGAGFEDSEIHLEVTQSGNIGGFVISDRFVGQAQVARQEALWEQLRRSLPQDQLVRIVSILTMAPDEVEDDLRAASS